MSITKRNFGTFEGQDVDLYTLTNKNGMSVSIMTYGGAMVNILTDDRNGKFADVILGFDDVYGARHLRRAIQSKVEDALSEKLLSGEIKAGDKIVCSFSDELIINKQ